MSEAGRYRVLQRIGSGGMAEVLEAIAVGEHGFERRVAIKRLLPGSDATRERMFLDEARIASRLHHANIVAVLDYGVLDGRPFQVLEHVDGLDAQALIARAGPLPVPLALHLCAMVGHALDHAHAACDATGTPLGIVHRDVTPSNVLVAWSGDVKLTDFGIAFAHARTEQTLDGTTKGTPLFMAPEQMLAGDIDRRTDLFALGCVLHALVTGKSPLSHEAQLLRLASGGELELDPALPDDVRAIVARATRAQRRDRHGDAGELVAAITQALAVRTTDPRLALREWLRALQPAPAPARGRLDALLDVELVLGSMPRRFVPATDATRPERLVRPADSAVDVAPVVVEATPLRPHGPPRRRMRWPLAAAGIAIVAIVVVIATTATSPSAALDPFEPRGAQAEGIEHWANKHKPAARELGEWIRRAPVTAAALFAWDDKHPVVAQELVTWANDNPTATADGFLAAHPGFAAIAQAHRADFDELVAWTRKYPVAAGNLMRRPRGLGWVGRQLDTASR